jgi:hypothetical protein
MKITGRVVGVREEGDFVDVFIKVKVEKGYRMGAHTEIKVSVAPHERRAYWVGRRVKVQVEPLGE